MILPSGLQYTLKRVGPKTDPCGTPYLTRLQQERELFTFTEVVRSTRYDRNHSKALSLTPIRCRHYLHIYKKAIYMGTIIMQVHRALVIKGEKG